MSEATQTTVRVLGWGHVLVMVAITLFAYFMLSAEVRWNSRLNRVALDSQAKEIQQVRNGLETLRNQNMAFCLQYESDMDRFFRNHPEFKRHPWICDTK